MEVRPVRRRGNLQRAEWRQKCRQKLAQHLTTVLGKPVEPHQVRLQPCVEDGYIWKPPPDREHLFARALSKLSIGTYQLLYREVGTSIFAIPHPGIESIQAEHLSKRARVSTSTLDLTSQVSRLQAETEKLADQLSVSEGQTQTERVVRQEAEEKARRLEGELSTARMDVGRLQRENKSLLSVNKQITKRMKRSNSQVKQARSVLHRLGPDPYGCDAVS